MRILEKKGNPYRGPDESNGQATTRLNNAGRIVLSRQSDTRVVAIIFLSKHSGTPSLIPPNAWINSV